MRPKKWWLQKWDYCPHSFSTISTGLMRYCRPHRACYEIAPAFMLCLGSLGCVSPALHTHQVVHVSPPRARALSDKCLYFRVIPSDGGILAGSAQALHWTRQQIDKSASHLSEVDYRPTLELPRA